MIRRGVITACLIVAVQLFTAAKPQQVGVDEAGLVYGYLAGSVTDLSAFAGWWMQKIKQNPPASQGKEYGSGLFKEEFDGQEIWWHSGLLHFHWHEPRRRQSRSCANEPLRGARG